MSGSIGGGWRNTLLRRGRTSTDGETRRTAPARPKDACQASRLPYRSDWPRRQPDRGPPRGGLAGGEGSWGPGGGGSPVNEKFWPPDVPKPLWEWVRSRVWAGQRPPETAEEPRFLPARATSGGLAIRPSDFVPDEAHPPDPLVSGFVSAPPTSWRLQRTTGADETGGDMPCDQVLWPTGTHGRRHAHTA